MCMHYMSCGVAAKVYAQPIRLTSGMKNSSARSMNDADIAFVQRGKRQLCERPFTHFQFVDWHLAWGTKERRANGAIERE